MPEANSNGMILAKDEENDAEVRREDQDKINEFGQLNARLHEIREESEMLKVRLMKLLFFANGVGVLCTLILFAEFSLHLETPSLDTNAIHNNIITTYIARSISQRAYSRK